MNESKNSPKPKEGKMKNSPYYLNLEGIKYKSCFDLFHRFNIKILQFSTNEKGCINANDKSIDIIKHQHASISFLIKTKENGK